MNKILNLCQRALTPPLGALLLISATLSSQPAYAFGKRPIVVPPAPPPPVTPTVPVPPPAPPTPSTGDVIRARWEGKARDGVAWSQHVFDTLPALAPNLLNRNPADIATFCPAYSALNADDKKNFWVYLFSSITELESNFDPTNTYKENFKDSSGNYVMSVGLLQLSITDGAAYGCNFKTNADLVDPIKNLDCGMRIMNKLVGGDGQIAGKIGTAWKGGARYWSTLRAPKVSNIEAWTKAQRICQ